MLLSAENISVMIGKQKVVTGVDIELAAGEVVGLIGPNGAGKSTLLRALAGLLKSDHSRLEIRGEPLERMSANQLAKTRAFLAQAGTVHWSLQVERVVGLGRFPHGDESSATGQQAIANAMSKTDVTTLVGRPIDQLSGGEAMRVALARLLAVEAQILLLDEPITGLDPGFQLQIMQVLRDEAALGRGIVVVLHDLSLAARYCDRLLMLDEGLTHAEGTPQEVLNPEGLAAVYGVQAECDFTTQPPLIRLLSQTSHLA